MDKRKSELVENEKALKKLNEHTETLYIKLGKYLFDNRAKQLTGAPYSAILKNIKSRIETSQKISGEIKVLRDTENELENLKKEIQEIDIRRKELEKTIPSLYEEIGSLAYSIYKKNSASFEQYESHFSELKNYDDELTDIEATIRKQEENEKAKPFFEKIAGRGQKALMMGKKLLKTRGLAGYYQNLGENLCTSGYFNNAPLPELSVLQEELTKCLKEINRHAASSAEKNGEMERLQSVLQEQIEGKKTGKKITELKKSIDATKNTVTDGFRDLGIACFKKHPASIGSDKEVAGLYEEIGQNVRKMDTHTGEIVRLTDEIEYLRLSEKIEIMKRSVASCTNGIEKYQAKIDNLNLEIDALEKERKNLTTG